MEFKKMPDQRFGQPNPSKRAEDEAFLMQLLPELRANRGLATTIDRCARPSDFEKPNKAYKELNNKRNRYHNALKRLNITDVKVAVRSDEMVSELWIGAIYE